MLEQPPSATAELAASISKLRFNESVFIAIPFCLAGMGSAASHAPALAVATGEIEAGLLWRALPCAASEGG
jgi:hypothetical protein